MLILRDTFSRTPSTIERDTLDVLLGDQTLFVHAAEAEASWQLYTPLLADRPAAHDYAAGTWGPAAADRLLAARGDRWHDGIATA